MIKRDSDELLAMPEVKKFIEETSEKMQVLMVGQSKAHLPTVHGVDQAMLHGKILTDLLMDAMVAGYVLHRRTQGLPAPTREEAIQFVISIVSISLPVVAGYAYDSTMKVMAELQAFQHAAGKA